MFLIKGYVSAFAAAILFGSVSTIAKPALVVISPLLLSSMVYLIAAGTMIPLLKANNEKIIPFLFSIKKRDCLLVIATALSGAVIAPTLYFLGLKQDLASNASILLNGEMALFAILFFREKLEK